MATTTELKLLADLRRPFTPAAVKFKIQTINQGGKAMIVAYIDARLTSARLNAVAGPAWEDRYEEIPGGLRCYLTVFGFTRCDVGEPGDSPQGKKPKALYSDAFKRAGVKWGIGESLYAVPRMYLEGNDLSNGKYISRTGEAKLRAGYAQWLKDTGEKAFGKAFDHGDVEDAAGDHEIVDRDPAPVIRQAPQSLTPRAADDVRRDPDTGAPLAKGEDTERFHRDGSTSERTTAAPPVQHTPPPTDARSPREMAVDAFKDWIPKGASKAADSERQLIKAAISELTGTPVADIGGVNATANTLYGLIGEAIQSKEECAAALSALVDEKRGQS